MKNSSVSAQDSLERQDNVMDNMLKHDPDRSSERNVHFAKNYDKILDTLENLSAHEAALSSKLGSSGRF